MSLTSKATTVLWITAIGLSTFFMYQADATQKELRAERVKYTNELAKSDSLETVGGGWEKRALELESLGDLLEEENDELHNVIDDKDQEIVSLTDSSIKWEGLYVELKDSANISDSTIVDEDGNERIRVSFNYEEGINRVDGFTLTNPPEASIQFDWTRPIDLTTVIAKGDDGGWYAYIDSPDTSFIPMDINVKIDPTAFEGPSHWYDNFWAGVGLGGGEDRFSTSFLMSYQLSDKRMVGFNYSYDSFGTTKGLTYQMRF